MGNNFFMMGIGGIKFGKIIFIITVDPGAKKFIRVILDVSVLHEPRAYTIENLYELSFTIVQPYHHGKVAEYYNTGSTQDP